MLQQKNRIRQTKVSLFVIGLYFSVSDLLKKLSSPLSNLTSPKSLPSELGEDSELQEVTSNSSLDEVICWWLEHPESQKTLVCVRKAPHTTIDVSVLSATSIGIIINASLSDEELLQISKGTKIAPEILAYNWTRESLIKETEISLKHPVTESPTVISDTSTFVVISFAMKKEAKLKFN
jgi:hypothetical protein